ncbi:MAG: magnesium transporter [Actinomycetota bacterium]
MASPVRRARRLWRFWRSEQRTLRQGFVALFISSGGDLLAGLALASMTGALTRLPGLFVLVPAAIGMRGNIFGALGSRLGTSIHAGTFEPTLRDRRGTVYQNAYAATVLTLASSVFLGVFARLISVALGQTSISVADFVAISILGGVLGSAVVGSVTVAMANLSNRKRWDMDAVSAPLVTAIGDVVTIPALWVASYVAGIPYVTAIVALVSGAFCVVVTVRGVMTRLPLARRVILESLPILALAGVLNILAGAIVEHRLDRFVAFPALLVLIPPFLEDTGALGGILASRLASKLHLGVISPRLVPEPAALLDTSIIFLFAISVFFFVGVSAWLVSRFAPTLPHDASSTLSLGIVVGIAMVAGFFATILSTIVAYLAAVATYRFGLDPDNHGIPIVTSTMDFLGAATLVATIAVFGVSAHV